MKPNMKKRYLALGILLIGLLLIGCAQQKVPELVCKTGYILNGDSCCKDQNANSLCDEDEDTLFAPSYAPSEETDEIEYEEPVLEYEEPAQELPAPKIIDVPEEKVYLEPEPPKIDYEALAKMPGLQDWYAENDKMSIEITKIIIDVNDIKPTSRLAPDKEAILKEIHFNIKNKGYNYMNFELLFRLQDSNDPLRIKEKLACNTDDDFRLEGCRQGFREGDVLNIKMTVNEKIDRVDLNKTFRFILENIRDSGTWNQIELSKTVNILEIEGAEYI